MIGQTKSNKNCISQKNLQTKPNIACPVQISPSPSCQETKQIYTISVWSAKQVNSYMYMITNVYDVDTMSRDK